MLLCHVYYSVTSITLSRFRGPLTAELLFQFLRDTVDCREKLVVLDVRRASFEVGLPHEGDWSLKATADDYDDSEPQTVTVPFTGTTLEFTILQSAAVSGLVVDPTGAPVEGAEVGGLLTQ